MVGRFYGTPLPVSSDMMPTLARLTRASCFCTDLRLRGPRLSRLDASERPLPQPRRRPMTHLRGSQHFCPACGLTIDLRTRDSAPRLSDNARA